MGAVTRPVAIVGALALVALAFLAVRTEPQEEVGFAPFAVQVPVGERGEGRGLQGAVDGALLADTVQLGDWTGETTGLWLVVQTRMATTENTSLGYATLQVGERSWAASNRPGSRGMQSVSLEPGLPMAGSFFFEVPADLLEDPAARSATVWLADDGDTRLITVVEVRLDLTALPHRTELEVAPKERITW